jgi:hypothetical protein
MARILEFPKQPAALELVEMKTRNSAKRIVDIAEWACNFEARENWAIDDWPFYAA